MSDQKALAADFGLKNAVVRSWLHHLSYVRNLCAHHSRVWNKSFAIKPIIPFGKSWEFLNHRNNKLFASFSILNHFIDKFSLEVDLLSKLKDLFDEYEKYFPFSLHVKMGFPEQYSDI